MIRTLEELFLNAWPALRTTVYDGWLLRFTGGYSKRANSVHPLYPSPLPLATKLHRCEAEYTRMDLLLIFKLTPESCPEELDQGLARRGYRRLEETVVRQLVLEERVFRQPADITVAGAFDRAWIKDFGRLAGLDPGQQQLAGAILTAVSGPVAVVKKLVDGATVGCGYGAIDQDWMGIFNLVVAAGHREKGYGGDIMEGILSVAGSLGVKRAYLAVTAGNVPAERLYRQLGFEEVYRYWYRKRG